MPYTSESQRRFFHADMARKKGIGPSVVKEFDQSSKGLKLPFKKKNSLSAALGKK